MKKARKDVNAKTGITKVYKYNHDIHYTQHVAVLLAYCHQDRAMQDWDTGREKQTRGQACSLADRHAPVDKIRDRTSTDRKQTEKIK